MPSTTKQQQQHQNGVGRVAADKAERPQSTLSASDGSDSGCSFGGISPVNFGWPLGENSAFQQQSGYATPSSRMAIRKHNAQEFEKTVCFHESATVAMSQTEWSTSVVDEKSLNYSLTPSKTLATNVMPFSSSTPSPPSPSPPPTLPAPPPLQPTSVSMQSLHPATGAISDITQYINPEIHNVRLNALQNGGRGAGLAGVTPKPSQQDMYKTVMCQAWLESTKCLFGENCKFAHGEAELRPARIINRNNAKYKTKLCEKYTTNGICPYGDRCLFIHPMSTSSISSSSSSVTENRNFVNPSFVNPDIRQRASNNSRHAAAIAASGAPDELIEVDNSDAQQKSMLHFAETNAQRSVESMMMFGDSSGSASQKKSSPPFLKSQSSFFAPITKKIAASQPPPSPRHQRSLLQDVGGASMSRKYSSLSATGAVEASLGYDVGNSNHSIWSERTIDSSYDKSNDNDKLQLQQQIWCAKLRSWQESAHLPDELHSRKTSSNCGQIAPHMQQHQQKFFEAQRRARYTQNEQNPPEFASTPLSSSSMMTLADKFGKPTSMLRRLNSATLMDSATRTAFLRCQTAQQRHIVGTAGANDSIEVTLDDHCDDVSPPKSYFNGSAALGHAESAIWSSDSSRFVMGGDHPSSLIHSTTHSVTGNSFFGSDYDEFLLEEEKPSISVITAPNFLNEPHDDDEAPFEQVYNTINSLMVRRKKEMDSKAAKEASKHSCGSLTKTSSSVSSSASVSSASLTASSNDVDAFGADENELQELMRHFELQKLEEYLIASERKLSLERNRNDFHSLGPFHNIAS